MPQLQNLVLTDRAATPVAHTFTPLDIREGVAAVIESSGVPVGNSKYTIGSPKRTNSGRYVIPVSLYVPVISNQVVNGIATPVVTRFARVKAEFDFDPTSTTQERKDLVGMFQSSLDSSKALTNDVLISLQGVY